MKKIHPQITQICADFFPNLRNLRNLRTPLSPRLSALAIIALLYFSAGGLCLSEPVPAPWGQPTPEAKWTVIVHRDDPRPFWVRLLLSIRYDFYHKDVRGGATF